MNSSCADNDQQGFQLSVQQLNRASQLALVFWERRYVQQSVDVIEGKERGRSYTDVQMQSNEERNNRWMNEEKECQVDQTRTTVLWLPSLSLRDTRLSSCLLIASSNPRLTLSHQSMDDDDYHGRYRCLLQ